MITRLPVWVIFGGILLSFIAGYINAIGILHNHAVSHMTGLSSQLAIGIAQGDLVRAIHLALVLISFFVGCVISGFLIQQSTLKLGRRYGVALIFESLCLFGAVSLLNRGRDSGYYLAAMACGLQNAMASTYSGAIIRTTHLTGFINDFGIAIGHLLRGLPIDRLRFGLYGAVFIGFLSGGITGILIFQQLGFDAIYFPATLLLVLGVVYFSYTHYNHYYLTKVERQYRNS
ncbi:MAG: YoaK family protein [Chloroflexi bacterium]|nr:YoaK family protein [Chloroflexota bacterium]